MIKIRPTDSLDVDDIERIEEASFSAPFSRDMFYGMLEGRPFGGLSALDGEKIVGYLFYSVVLDEMELVTVAVEERYRKKGIARRLIEEMLETAAINSVKKIFLEVRVSNASAQSLYKGFGFRDVSIRPKYYKDNNEDAIVMIKKIDEYLM